VQPADPLVSPDYAGWWQRNVALLKAYWRPLLTLQLIAAVVSLVVRIPTGIWAAVSARQITATPQPDPSQALRALSSTLPALSVSAIGGILAALVSVLVTLACIRLLVVAVTSGQVSVGDSMRAVVNRLFPMIGWSLLAGLIVLAGVCACVIPGLYFGAVFATLPAVVLFERGGVIARCFKLFHSDFGASLARVATTAGIAIAGALVSAVIGGIIAAISGTATGGVGGAVVATIITTVIGVAIAAVVGVIAAPLTLTTYADERARTELLHTGILAHELTTA
jgi:hypothetical protein